ncbi:DUF6069 family protein [Actinoplanes sp. TRM 88003]|uniref:DUF6069 family protein n=1 Tax=Paractinoplanes aksuensis TaxID=2939490 RepID=A0ABT1DL86_9ACTN|nr:DUF6069 family protein [Actinoplanes aksuensis]MCO8270790.1 DUF6069 family protein [Actinoplanes aksuensis]
MRNRPAIIALAAAAAIIVNLIVHAAGRAAGGSFRFTNGGVTNEVDAVTVAGFSAVPLLIGLLVVAMLSRLGPWVARVAVVVAPVLAVVTIFVMTVPADLDRASTVALALCHLTLIPISVRAIRLISGAAARPALAPTG